MISPFEAAKDCGFFIARSQKVVSAFSATCPGYMRIILPHFSKYFFKTCPGYMRIIYTFQNIHLIKISIPVKTFTPVQIATQLSSISFRHSQMWSLYFEKKSDKGSLTQDPGSLISRKGPRYLWRVSRNFSGALASNTIFSVAAFFRSVKNIKVEKLQKIKFIDCWWFLGTNETCFYKILLSRMVKVCSWGIFKAWELFKYNYNGN